MKEISAALVKARRKFGPALKDKSNPHFRSKYADLGACLDAVDDALLEHGIALTQETDKCEDGVLVRTVLVHESGERMDFGWLHVPASKQDAQGYGSALTYARRYSLMAACGIAPEDDDGNAAAKAPPKTFRSTPTDGPLEVAPERRHVIELAASLAVAKFKKGDELGAYEEISGISDSEEKLYLWKVLKAESALRAFIQKHSRELREKEMEPA